MSQPTFVITLTGEMDGRLRAEFEDVEVTVDHGVTRLRVLSVDRSVLHGVLNRIDLLHLELLDVERVPDWSPGSPDPG